MSTSRDLSIDAVKGVAIILVVMVFMGWYMPDPTIFHRFLFTMEMPLFYITAGFTVALTARKHSLNYFLKRSFVLLLFDGLIDVLVWKKLPLLYGSPLTTIALALPICFLLSFARPSRKLMAFFIVIAISVFLQHFVGYREYFQHQRWWWEYTSFSDQIQELSGFTPILKSIFIDGWAPLFPYLSFFIFGVWVADRRTSQKFESTILKPLILWPALGVASVVWWLHPGEMYKRFGYLELCYPPVPGYVLFVSLFFLVLISIFDQIQKLKINQWLGYFGRAPFASFIYVNVVMRYLVYPQFQQKMSLLKFLSVYIFLLLVLALIIYVLTLISKALRGKRVPLVFKMILGGS